MQKELTLEMLEVIEEALDQWLAEYASNTYEVSCQALDWVLEEIRLRKESPEEAVTLQVFTGPQALAQAMAALFEDKIDPLFMEASEHPGYCDCAICLDWWVEMGPDGKSYGPFDRETVVTRAKELGKYREGKY